jgi:GDPmannose 4,6-dehydratase
MKRVLIVGAAGQDGTLLARLLGSRGIDHIGLGRAGSIDPSNRFVRAGSLDDAGFLEDLIKAYAPTDVYYLAAHHQSSQEEASLDSCALWRESLRVQVAGLVNVLEAIRRYVPSTRLFYASSSHIFGSSGGSPQTEETPHAPETIYGITKCTGMQICRHYRRDLGVFASVGILYNHESIYRKETFLSRKIIRAALAIKQGSSDSLVLGDLSRRVDWGYAPHYVEAMTRILDLPEPEEYIVATGELHSVREFAEIAFAQHGMDYRDWVREDRSLIRRQSNGQAGDAGKLRRATGWLPTLSFPQLVKRLTRDTCRQVAPA